LRQLARRRLLGRLLKLGFLVLGVSPLLLGTLVDWPVLVVAGALVVLAGLIAMLK
jgi:hypothetical protein